jgi:Predicted Zn-dependent peptidases
MKISTIRLLSIGFVFLFSASVSAGKLKQDPKLVTGKLSNGLTYYIYPNNYPKGEAVFRLFIKSGSVYEEESQRGLAHFLEHMAFNGTKTFSGNSMIRYLESKGAMFGKDLNAHTSFNETVYKLQLPTNDPGLLDTTMTILADWADGLLLDGKEIDSERGVILSEWLSKTGPEKDAENAFLLDVLNGSRFSERLVIGDTAVIRHFPYERLREYYQQWYHPQLMAVAIAGDVDVRRTEKLIHQKFEGIDKPMRGEAPQYDIPDYAGEKAKVIVQESLGKIEYNRMQLVPVSKPVSTQEAYQDYLQRLLLNRLMKSRFSSFSFENPPYKNPSVSVSNLLNTKGILYASVELIPNKVDSGIQTFSRQLEQMYRFGFIPLEIEKAKKSYMNTLRRSVTSKSPVNSMDFMDQLYSCFYRGEALITPQMEYKLARKYIDSIDSLSLVTMLRQMVKPQQTHYMITAFDKVSKELPSEERILSMSEAVRKENIEPYSKLLDIPETLLSRQPKAGKVIGSRLIDGIGARELTLSNGAKVIFRRSTTKKSQLSLTSFRQGGLYALDSTNYVSGLYAGGIISLSGAGEFSREALNHFMAGNTASVRYLIDKTRSGVAATANMEDKETLFQLMYLKWTAPRVDSSLFAQTKQKAIESYLTDNRTDEQQFARDFGYLLQGRNYTNRELTDTILNTELREESLLPVFNRSFGSARDYTFILTADCQMDELMPLILKYIGGLPSGKPQTTYVYAGPRIPKTSVVFERKVSDSPKAVVTLAFQNDRIGENQRIYDLKGEIMQSVLRTKLMKVLREELGMVYSVGVSIGSTLHPSELSRNTIAYTCLPENVNLLVDKSMEQIKRMVADPACFEQELKDVKANLVKDMGLESQKDSFWSTFIRNSLFNGETDWDYVANFENIVNGITANQIAGMLDAGFLKTPMVRAVMFPKDGNKNNK